MNQLSPGLPAKPAHRHRGLVRISSVSVASVLAILIGTSIVPPLVADQSDRAVVNAPVTLLTAPIAGDVEGIQVRAGDTVAQGTRLATISNNRLDRTTAIQLDGKVMDLRERALSTERKRLSNLVYIDALDKTIQERSSQMVQILRSQVEELRAKISSAEASGEEKRVLMDRQTSLVARNVASPDMVKSSAQAYAAAIHEKGAASAKLTQKLAQLDGLSRGIYGGDELNGLAELTQKRLAIAHDTQRLSIEETELKASLADQQRLLERESKRMDSLSYTEVRAPADGLVFNLDAAVGRHVSAGDSLASLVDCERSFVVAIFSYRQGQNLQVGSQVDIGGLAGGVRKGQVTEILPKTSDKVDATYAVPFPQTERRELYVLVKPDAVATPVAVADSGRRSDNGCGVGRWVTVTRESGWVPSTSVAWRTIQEQTANLMGWGKEAVPAVVASASDPAEVAPDWKPDPVAPQPSIAAVAAIINTPTRVQAPDDLFRAEAAPVVALQKPVAVPAFVEEKPSAIPVAVEQKPAPAPVAIVEKPAAVPVAAVGKPAALAVAALQWPPVMDLAAPNRPARSEELRPVTVPRPPVRPQALKDVGARPVQPVSGPVRAKPESGAIRIVQGGVR